MAKAVVVPSGEFPKRATATLMRGSHLLHGTSPGGVNCAWFTGMVAGTPERRTGEALTQEIYTSLRQLLSAKRRNSHANGRKDHISPSQPLSPSQWIVRKGSGVGRLARVSGNHLSPFHMVPVGNRTI